MIVTTQTAANAPIEYAITDGNTTLTKIGPNAWTLESMHTDAEAAEILENMFPETSLVWTPGTGRPDDPARTSR